MHSKITVPEKFRLTNIELQSAIWKKLYEYIEKERDLLRKRNDGAIDPIDTARLRGEIKAYNKLLDLAKGPATTL